MKRREFITGLGAAAWPVALRAQQRPPVVAYLSVGTQNEGEGLTAAFREGLGERGYAEGRNVDILYRWSEGHSDRLPALAADVVRRRVAVILANTELPALAAKSATATIPIVFAGGADPVELGLVAKS